MWWIIGCSVKVKVGVTMGMSAEGVSNHLMEAVAGRNMSLTNGEFRIKTAQGHT